jgi:hypothetical protein
MWWFSARGNLQIASLQFMPPPWTLPAIGRKITTMTSRIEHRESKSFQNGGDSMKTNGIKTNRRCRRMTYMAMLSAAIFTILLLPAYGQQEVDPTWYDPSPATSTAAVPASQPSADVQAAQVSVAAHPTQQTVRSDSVAPAAALIHGKHTGLDQGRGKSTQKRSETPSAEIRMLVVAFLAELA